MRFVGLGPPMFGPLSTNTARNTADVIVVVYKAMEDPGWPQSRRFLSSGRGDLREFRRLLCAPIMCEARLLAVVLSMETEYIIIDACNRAGVARDSDSDDDDPSSPLMEVSSSDSDSNDDETDMLSKQRYKMRHVMMTNSLAFGIRGCFFSTSRRHKSSRAFDSTLGYPPPGKDR